MKRQNYQQQYSQRGARGGFSVGTHTPGREWSKQGGKLTIHRPCLGAVPKKNQTHFIDFKSRNEEVQPFRRLSLEESKELQALKTELSFVEDPKQPLKAYQLFLNKQFNEEKACFPHLPTSQLNELLADKWKHQMTDEEKESYFKFEHEEVERYKE